MNTEELILQAFTYEMRKKPINIGKNKIEISNGLLTVNDRLGFMNLSVSFTISRNPGLTTKDGVALKYMHSISDLKCLASVMDKAEGIPLPVDRGGVYLSVFKELSDFLNK